MGLDTTWYRGLTRDDSPEAQEAAEEGEDNCVRLYANPDFPGREAPLQMDGVYRYKASGREGWHGSYGAYNRWRDQLAKLAGYPLQPYEKWGAMTGSHAAGAWVATEGPFWELVNFSDCDGFIGTAACAKLAADFETFQPQADAHDDEYFRESYATMRTAFTNAADNGAVDFH
jgi:hypothetical protein